MLGVIIDGRVAGCLRIHPYWTDWMACTVFREVTPDNGIQKPNTCEVSRLAVDRRYRSSNVVGNRQVSDLLYQCLFAYCKVNNIRKSYMIVSRPTLTHLHRRGLHCQVITPDHKIRSTADSPILTSLEWDKDVPQGDAYYFPYHAVANKAQLATQSLHKCA
jgi:N-acyl-L-homoserine lactone synthetase